MDFTLGHTYDGCQDLKENAFETPEAWSLRNPV